MMILQSEESTVAAAEALASQSSSESLILT